MRAGSASMPVLCLKVTASASRPEMTALASVLEPP